MADILTLRKFEALSPSEIKDELIKLAKAASRTTQSAFLGGGDPIEGVANRHKSYAPHQVEHRAPMQGGHGPKHW